MRNAQCYAEYGCGESTVWVAHNTNCRILSVDTSSVWVSLVQESCTNVSALKVRLQFVDLGPLGRWGRPRNYTSWKNFQNYTDWIWNQNISPDVVMIDGRFRVCCFLTSLLNAQEGTRIIFDDYANRSHYHFIESFIRPDKVSQRQALFTVPKKDCLDTNHINFFIDKFRFVLD